MSLLSSPSTLLWYRFKCDWHHWSLLVNQLVIKWKGQSLSQQNDYRDSQLASQSDRKRIIGLCCPKPLCGYPVPACCHGNAVWDLNTSPCPFPTSLLSSSLHSSRLSPRFLWVCELTLSLRLSVMFPPALCLFRLPPSPCLVLSAKWHFTSCFLLLIPCYFASCDSVKSSCKTHSATQSRHTRDKLQSLTVCTHTRNYFNISRQMHECSQAQTLAAVMP